MKSKNFKYDSTNCAEKMAQSWEEQTKEIKNSISDNDNSNHFSKYLKNNISRNIIYYCYLSSRFGGSKFMVLAKYMQNNLECISLKTRKFTLAIISHYEIIRLQWQRIIRFASAYSWISFWPLYPSIDFIWYDWLTVKRKRTVKVCYHWPTKLSIMCRR